MISLYTGRRAALLAVFLLLPAVPFPLAAAPAEESAANAATISQAPTADEIIGRHIEAIGGQAAIDAVQTMRYERVYVHIEEERIYHRLVHRKRPGMMRNCSLDDGSCFLVDGARSWTRSVDPDDGTVTWSEDEYLGSQSNNFEMRFGPFINYRDKGITVDFVETEVIDGVSAHHLKMQMNNGELWDIYFDVDTGLWSRFVTPGGGTVTIHDYRPAGDILFPRLTEVNGTRRDGTPAHHLNAIVSLEINAPADDSLFRPDPDGARPTARQGGRPELRRRAKETPRQ